MHWILIGKSNFNNIEYYNIKNDCLDISGAQINGSIYLLKYK